MGKVGSRCPCRAWGHQDLSWYKHHGLQPIGFHLPPHFVSQHPKEVGADEVGYAGGQECHPCKKKSRIPHAYTCSPMWACQRTAETLSASTNKLGTYVLQALPARWQAFKMLIFFCPYYWWKVKDLGPILSKRPLKGWLCYMHICKLLSPVISPLVKGSRSFGIGPPLSLNMPPNQSCYHTISQTTHTWLWAGKNKYSKCLCSTELQGNLCVSPVKQWWPSFFLLSFLYYLSVFQSQLRSGPHCARCYGNL